jgi:superfamily I DNA and/or RNA helicase
VPELLQRFIDSFVKAVTVEMEAMRQRLGSFEMPLADGTAMEREGDQRRYGFRVVQLNDKLVVHGECTLVTGGGEALVTILSLDGDQIVLGCERDIDPHQASPILVIYPWFLYQKLLIALRNLLGDDSYCTDSALALFGRRPPRDFDLPPLVSDGTCRLNASQRQAVHLSCSRTPAFVWGPPGTGKTTTLGHIVLALLDLDQRILITSTTNAAVDQALDRLMELDEATEALERGQIVRIGQGGERSHASLPQVVRRLNGKVRDELAGLHQRRARLRTRIEGCVQLLAVLADAGEPQQLGLFGNDVPAAVNPWRLGTSFGERHASAIMGQSRPEQQRLIARRQRRLEAALGLLEKRVSDRLRLLRHEETRVVREARVVLATMSNVYINRLLEPERFDTVIVEEAGMCVLPTLFYCACLARQRTIMVGDPRQLPPIVQSNQHYVHRAMGRGIFAVTVPQPHDSDLVAMLDTQYRMHPDIGDLVGRLFYDGRLRHGDNTRDTQAIADRSPYPGAPVVVVDTAGSTTCAARQGGYSRYNEASARLCVDLAIQAVGDGIASVAIITPYVEQSRLIRRLLSAAPELSGKVECRTVHRFQGGERDMVILDTVDAEPLPPGILLAGSAPGASSSNLINVSISRARGKLVVVADVAYFRRHPKARLLSHVLHEAIRVGRREVPTVE